MEYLSVLIGDGAISDDDLTAVGAEILEDRKLRIPSGSIEDYLELIKEKLEPGFWNEVVGEKIVFVFKFKTGEVKEFSLAPENEKEISHLCSEFNGDSLEKTSNVYRYLSENSFYHDLMIEYYGDIVNR